MNTIFLAGVHGVGKSTIAISIAKTLGFGHFGASQLIREEREKISWTSDKKTSNLYSN